MTDDLLPETTQQPMNAMVEIEKSRAVQEVQAKLVIAKKFPRDETECYTRIVKSCGRYSLAEQAIYSLPISGKTMQGPSIRLAEEIARNWKNISFGWRVIDRSNGRSKCVAFCWDQETNTTSELEFEVEHWIEVGKAGAKTRKVISDPIEIDRLEASRAARKVRNCILNVVPGDVVEGAVKAVRETLRKGEGNKTLVDRIREAVVAFEFFGVSQEMIEVKLGHKLDPSLTTVDEIVELQAIYKSLVDKQAKRSDYFKMPDEEGDDSLSSGLREKLKERKTGEKAGTEKAPSA